MTLFNNVMGLCGEHLNWYQTINLHLFLKTFEIGNWLFYPQTTEKHHGAE